MLSIEKRTSIGGSWVGLSLVTAGSTPFVANSTILNRLVLQPVSVGTGARVGRSGKKNGAWVGNVGVNTGAFVGGLTPQSQVASSHTFRRSLNTSLQFPGASWSSLPSSSTPFFNG